MKTIAEVLSDYKNCEGVVYGRAVREAIEKYAETRSNEHLNNDSYADALFLTDIMFSRTRRRIDILTGPGAGDFLQSLESSFMTALDRIEKASGKVRLILIGNSVPEYIADLAQKYAAVFEYRKATAAHPDKVRHMILCDDEMLRDEEPHPELTPSSFATDIKAKVYLNSPARAEMSDRLFQRNWDNLTK